MQACHRDKMRFNILDGKSSVVWPSSLHPGLESKCCERKGGLPSVVTHLNAKDAFLPSSLSFFLLSSLWAPQFLPPFFSFYGLIISSLPLVCFLSPPPNFPPTIQFLSCFATSLLLHLTQLHLVLLCSDADSLKAKITSHLLYLTLKIDCTIVCELMKLYLTKLFCICVMKHANEARSQGFAKKTSIPVKTNFRSTAEAD